MDQTNPLTSLIEYTVEKIISNPNGSGIISASRQRYLLEIVEGIIEQLKADPKFFVAVVGISDNNKIKILEWKKLPYHRLTFDNGFLIYFRPACFKGESYRGIHVDTFTIMYEVERIKDLTIWNEFYRTMKPGCEARVFCGSSQRAQRKI